MKYRHAMTLLLVSLPICVILRIIQTVYTLDVGTGFIKPQYSTIALLISIIVCAATAAVALLTAIADIKCKESTTPQLAIAISSLLLGGMLIYRMVATTSAKLQTIAWQESFVKNAMILFKSIAWYDGLLLILTVLSAIVFFVYGLRNISSFKMPTVMLAIPVFYFIVKLISVFVSTSSLALVTENVFLVFTNSAVLWFMFEFSNFENGVGDANKKIKKIFASGVASTILCSTMAIPRFVTAIVYRTTMTAADISSSLLDIAIVTFVLSYIVCKFGEIQKTEKAPSKHSA